MALLRVAGRPVLKLKPLTLLIEMHWAVVGSPVVFSIYTPILENNIIEIISKETTQNELESSLEQVRCFYYYNAWLLRTI